MTTTRYKGFRIEARPYQIQVSRQWTVDLEIHRNGRKQPFSLKQYYPTQHEAEAQCKKLGREIIDGEITGWSVDHLRHTGFARHEFVLIPWVSMRPIIIAGIVLLGLGAFLLIKGGSFSSRRDVLKVGDVKVTADEKKSIPPWTGWLAVTAGFGCILIGRRQTA